MPMTYHEDGEARIGKLAHDSVDIGFGADIDAACWFVEDQHRSAHSAQ
ncbi:hypothetical protein ACFKHW_39395 (plasmid) [Bradyrhizobium lupini]